MADDVANRFATTLGVDVEPADTEVSDVVLPERYRDLGLLAVGGMGRLRLVKDRVLGRRLVMKILRASPADRPDAAQRFLDEAWLTANLQHPGIVPIHDQGTLSDGRPWFTMKEVAGETLAAVIAAAHAPRLSEPGLRRLASALEAVSHAVGYAHSHGVVHRDIKPDNIMVGAFDEVLVMDWGIARYRGEQLTAWDGGAAPLPTETVAGTIIGTPVYMAPEQARGDNDAIDQRCDVYALGAVLYEMLSGRPPFSGSTAEVLEQVTAGQRPPLPDRIPQPLRALCAEAMALAPGDRPADASVFARRLRAWLDGEARREQALSLVEQARARQPAADALRAEAWALRADAAEALAAVRPHTPAAEKHAAWALEDRASDCERAARLEELGFVQTLHAALNLSDVPAAHAMLADHYRQRLTEAEQRRDTLATDTNAALLRAHDDGRHAAWLAGDGTVTLRTDPPGARVDLYAFQKENRRLVPVRVRSLGTTPLAAVPLPRGSYLLRVSAPGHHCVDYPVSIGRQEHWRGAPPGHHTPHAIWLPPEGSLRPGECYVPAGWFQCGGDPSAPESLSARRLWADGFIVQQQPVTVCAYLDYVNTLAEVDAEAAVPREPVPVGSPSQEIFLRTASGYRLDPKLDYQLDWPIMCVDWAQAARYARWAAARDGLPWRLPLDTEWEKAARGVDGRPLPWGDHFDPSWACCADSVQGTPRPAAVTDFPGDVSAYGVRGTAGNVREWCANPYAQDGPPDGSQIGLEADPATVSHRMVRGGSWLSKPTLCRLSVRFADAPDYRSRTCGFRLLRPVPS